MNEVFSTMTAMSAWEAFATVLAITYVILAAKGSIWCWPAALISTAIFSVIFYDVSLLMESLLNAYYMAMAVYGYFAWRKAQQNIAPSSTVHLPIIRWHKITHCITIISCSLIGLTLGYWMTHNTQADLAYLDSLTTVFAIFTTYLVTMRVLENWLYWIVINLASIYLYLSKDLYFLTFLMVIYTFIAIWGYIQWRNSYYLKTAANSSESKAYAS